MYIIPINSGVNKHRFFVAGKCAHGLTLHCSRRLSLLAGLSAFAGGRGGLDGLGILVDEGLVDVGDDTASGNGGLDQGVKLLVTTDGKQQVARSDALDLQVLAGISGKLENLSSEVLHNCGGVDSRGGTDTLVVVNSQLEESVDTTHRELQTSSRRTRLGRSLGGSGLSSLSSLSTFATFAFTAA